VIIATNFTAGARPPRTSWPRRYSRDVRVTRLARRAVGSELEYVDLGTIAHAFVDRR
jgi:recombination protein RecR